MMKKPRATKKSPSTEEKRADASHRRASIFITPPSLLIFLVPKFRYHLADTDVDTP